MTVHPSGRHWIGWELGIAAALGVVAAAAMLVDAPSAIPIATVLGGLIGTMVATCSPSCSARRPLRPLPRGTATPPLRRLSHEKLLVIGLK